MPDVQTSRSLTEHVRETLAEQIASGQFQPGEQLPTERELIADFGVSRTVVRDAVSRLRAQGLVESRQGAGVFVRDPAEPLVRARTVFATLSSIIETLEVRTALEIEASRLAAVRGSPAQLTEICERWDAMQGASDPERAERDDLAFHLSIAKATNNRRFSDFFDYLGPMSIPRTQMRAVHQMLPPEFVNSLLEEHKAIRDAIIGRDPDAAGEAMRRHLEISQARYVRLARSKSI